MTSGISSSSLQLNMQLLQGALKSSSKISNSQNNNSEQPAVYAKEGDAKYDKAMDANEDGTVTYEEYIKYCEEHAASTYSQNPSFTAVAKVKDADTEIESVRPLNIGKALGAYSNSGIRMPEAHIKSEA